jgi:hypothetical protein
MSNVEYKTCFAHVRLSHRAIALVSAFIVAKSLQHSNEAIKASRERDARLYQCNVTRDEHFDTYKVVEACD